MLAKFCALDSDFYKKLYFPAGLFIVTELIYLVALGIFRSGSTFVFLPIAMPVGCGAYMLIYSTATYLALFELSVQMGRTRREVILSTFAYIFLQNAVVILCAFALTLLDLLILFKGWLAFNPMLHVSGFDSPTPLWLLALALFAPGICALCFSALRLRFGQNAFAFIWLVFILVMAALNALEPVISALPVYSLAAVPLAVIAFIAWSLRYLGRASV